MRALKGDDCVNVGSTKEACPASPLKGALVSLSTACSFIRRQNWRQQSYCAYASIDLCEQGSPNKVMEAEHVSDELITEGESDLSGGGFMADEDDQTAMSDISEQQFPPYLQFPFVGLADGEGGEIVEDLDNEENFSTDEEEEDLPNGVLSQPGIDPQDITAADVANGEDIQVFICNVIGSVALTTLTFDKVLLL